MESLLGIVVLLLLFVGGPLLKRYLEKQQAEREAAQRRLRQVRPPAPTSEAPAGRPVFYGRASEPQPPAPPTLPDHLVMAPKAGPTAAASWPPPSRKARPASKRQAARPVVAPVPEPEPALLPVGQLEARHLEAMKGPEASSLRTRRLQTRGEKAKAPAGPKAAPAFLAEALRAENLARAIVLADILGPPRGLDDL